MMLFNALMVAIGAICGVLGRALLSKKIDREKKQAFPIATFSINMIGCFVLGLVVGFPLDQHLLLMLSTGVIGTFTTFSTFNAENIHLLRKKRYALFVCYAGATFVFGILLITFGQATAHFLS
ncbi:fluoride efflux transporter CrcB [Sporolactobacillus kofuensis]|uniref:Fluoride-specific ion channel FluC n=1 Tax=Sporolactobacillus kofuensis TaxID=269672 RepID=A0ABW1WFX9_9BACL|nr:fluoride efflux transporter CrcB [Sporolactobacillus kofuensis]MCO7175789.1 fluoride efflux transporter CrcB [Sporolactobacillus kofuensis]